MRRSERRTLGVEASLDNASLLLLLAKQPRHRNCGREVGGKKVKRVKKRMGKKAMRVWAMLRSV